MSRSSFLVRSSMLVLSETAQCEARLVEEAEKVWEEMTDLVACLMLRGVPSQSDCVICLP